MIDRNRTNGKLQAILGLKEVVVVGQEVLALFHKGVNKELVEVIAVYNKGWKHIGNKEVNTAFKWNKAATALLREIAEDMTKTLIEQVKERKIA